MTGGLMSLLATGSQDVYLTTDPQMSYFKQVYQRPTNFGMQSYREPIGGNPSLSGTTGIFTCKLPRYGDLLKDVALSLQLPAIYSDDTYRFRWITNMQYYLLVNYSINVDTYTIDYRYGEWLDIWNELSLTQDKKNTFNNLIGNIQEYMNPTNLSPIVIIKNNKIAFSYYPASTPSTPSLASREIYIPLDFWFCKNPALALPLIALQYQNVTINVTFNSIESLYQVYDHTTNTYMSPITYNSLYGTRINIGTFTRYGGGGSTVITNLNAVFELNYIYLDTPERTYIAQTSTIQMLIERVSRNQVGGGVTDNYTFPLILSNPIKEFIWVLRRRDAVYFNDYANYTASQPADESKSIMTQAKFIWNGSDRIEFKNAGYYNLLQPYMYHTGNPRQGIYVYSLSLYPEKIQPSGSFNASMVQTIQLQLNTNNFTPSQNSTITSLANKDTSYDLIVYTIGYNVFKIVGGVGQMAFNL